MNHGSKLQAPLICQNAFDKGNKRDIFAKPEQKVRNTPKSIEKDKKFLRTRPD